MPEPETSYFDPTVLARLSNLYLKARWVVEGVMSGLHKSRAKGFSVDPPLFQSRHSLQHSAYLHPRIQLSHNHLPHTQYPRQNKMRGLN